MKPFDKPITEIDSNASKFARKDESMIKGTTLSICITISSAIVIAGMILFAMYFLSIENSKILTKIPSVDLNEGKLATEEHELGKIPNAKNPLSRLSPSTELLGSTDALQLNSTMTRAELTTEEHYPGKFLNTKNPITMQSTSTVHHVNAEALQLESSTNTEELKHPDCTQVCSRVNKPVCGTNNETYSNECVLKFVACKANDGNLKIAYQGSCRSSFIEDACCSELMIESSEISKNWNRYVMGRYKFHSFHNGRPMYKSVRTDFYMLWSMKNYWILSYDTVGPNGFLMNPICNDRCVHDCSLHDWEFSTRNKIINDFTLDVECQDTFKYDVDPCNNQKPLEISTSEPGLILSPSIPYKNQNHLACEWHITADIGHIIKATFLEFDLPEGNEISEVSVYDGKTMSESRVGTFTGNLSSIQHTIFTTVSDMYIKFESFAGRLGHFKIRYDIEQCDWSDWEVGDCSKTCGGGQKTKTRILLNENQSIANCGLQHSIEVCNVLSCTESICKELEIVLSNGKSTFQLQNVTTNDRPVYRNLQYIVFMYSIESRNAETDGCWMISNEIGSDIGFTANCVCKDDATPVNCNYGWMWYKNGAWVLDSESKMICNV